jgi:hypothetical protein
MKFLDQISVKLRNRQTRSELTLYINVDDNSLSRKWLRALNHLLTNNYHLEKNYCFFGFPDSERSPEYICDQINATIAAINAADIGYHINDHFSVANTVAAEGRLDRDRFNQLHRYFEDLQGVSGRMSEYYLQAQADTRWHIRQLNLLCHEYESLILSQRKAWQAPEWIRPSMLMCWLNAPRFELETQDLELFGVDTISRGPGMVYVGVNKAVGKHHWEVFTDEGRDSRLDELTTTTLKSQTEAAGDFDIEWGRDPAPYDFQRQKLDDFRAWLRANGFDPEDPALTIGHPRVAQVDLIRSFGTTDTDQIWDQLNHHMDVHEIRTADARAIYEYHWSDADFQQRQVDHITRGT